MQISHPELFKKRRYYNSIFKQKRPKKNNIVLNKLRKIS